MVEKTIVLFRLARILEQKMRVSFHYCLSWNRYDCVECVVAELAKNYYDGYFHVNDDSVWWLQKRFDTSSKPHLLLLLRRGFLLK